MINYNGSLHYHKILRNYDDKYNNVSALQITEEDKMGYKFIIQAPVNLNPYQFCE